VGAKDFCSTFPKLAQNVFVRRLSTNFLPQNHEDLCGVASKKGLMCFSANVWRHFFPDFLGFFPDFRQTKTFGGAIIPPAPPPLTPLNGTIV